MYLLNECRPDPQKLLFLGVNLDDVVDVHGRFAFIDCTCHAAPPSVDNLLGIDTVT